MKQAPFRVSRRLAAGAAATILLSNGAAAADPPAASAAHGTTTPSAPTMVLPTPLASNSASSSAPSAPSAPPRTTDDRETPESLSPGSAEYDAFAEKAKREMAEGRHAEAARTLTLALLRGAEDDSAPAPALQLLSDLRVQARSHIAAVRVRAEKGVSLALDGESLGSAPLLEEVLVEPGRHRFVAQGPVCVGKKDIDVRAGQTIAVDVPCPADPAWRAPLLVTGLVTASFSVTGGLALMGIAEVRRADIDTLLGRTRKLNRLQEKSLASLKQERTILVNAAFWSLIAGGACLAATGTLLLATSPRRPAVPTPTVRLSVGPAEVSLSVRW